MRRGASLLAALAVAACASPGVPPGGPEDNAPPRLLRISPDTGAVGVRPREVVFAFDEVVSETPRGAGVGGSGGAGTAGAGSTLEPLVLVSPRSGSVEVDWRRDRIAVRPRRGFRDSTTYTVTLLAGLSDLRDNVRDTAVVTVFSTGGPIARTRLGGVVFDWVNGKPAARAVVEAIAPDSTIFYTIADSVGRFTIPNLPIGPYLVKGTVDVNTNRTADPREAFDSVRVGPEVVQRSDTAAAELYAFVRDTIGPRLASITPRDSLTLRLTFDRPLLPGQPLTPATVRIATADSAVVPVAAVYLAADFDSLQARRTRAVADSTARARADSLARAGRPDTAAVARARADSAARADSLRRAARDTVGGRRRSVPPPVLRRPVPGTDLVVVLGAPLRPQTAHRVSVRDVVSLNRRTRSSDRPYNTPRAEPARPAAPTDTTRRPPPPPPRR